MINTGYHNDDVWYSVLFQLAHSMFLMQEKDIYITDFNLENNVFIKDLFSNQKVLAIGNIELMVFLIMFQIMVILL